MQGIFVGRCVYVYAMAARAHRGQEKVSDSLELQDAAGCLTAQTEITLWTFLSPGCISRSQLKIVCTHESWVPVAATAVEFPGTGVTGGCEPPD